LADRIEPMGEPLAMERDARESRDSHDSRDREIEPDRWELFESRELLELCESGGERGGRWRAERIGDGGLGVRSIRGGALRPNVPSESGRMAVMGMVRRGGWVVARVKRVVVRVAAESRS
jgi:hypothetical protein